MRRCPIRFWTSTLFLGALAALPIAAQETGGGGQKKQDEKPPVEAPKQEPLKIGSVVPETLTLNDLEGKPLSFKDLRGKVVIVHFWSHRCPAEKHGDPVFKSLEKYYAGKDVVMVGIVSNQDELGPEPAKDAKYEDLYANLKKKIKEVGHTHRILADHGNKVSDLFQAKSTPHCFVIDAKGKLAYAGALDDDQKGEKGEGATVYVRDAADALLAGKEVAVKDTKPYG